MQKEKKKKMWSHLISAGKLLLSGANLIGHNNIPALFLTVNVRGSCLHALCCSAYLPLSVFLCAVDVQWHLIVNQESIILQLLTKFAASLHI